MTTSSEARPRRSPGRPPGGSEEQFQARRLEVLREAARLFNEQGFHLSSLSDLADRLKVTKPSIYYYVPSKDALLFECCSIAQERLLAAFADASRQATGLDRLRTFFRHYTKIIVDDFGRCLVLSDPRSFEPGTREAVLQGQREVSRQIASVIRSGIEDGSIRPCDAKLATASLFSLFNGVAKWWRPERDANAELIADALLDLVIRGLEGKRSDAAADPR